MVFTSSKTSKIKHRYFSGHARSVKLSKFYASINVKGGIT